MHRVVVSTFPNAKALPLWAGVEHNLFAEHGLDFILHETGSSKEQRTSLQRQKSTSCRQPWITRWP